MKQYEILIVLCPGEPTKNCQFLEIENNKIYDSKVYLGGEVRMKAAVNLSKKAETIILVGGSERKVSCMKNYILQRIKGEDKKKPEECIIRIESDTDTNGNLHAIKKALGLLSEIESKLFFLTNKYHIERVKLFAKDKDIFGYKFNKDQFIEAEGFAKKINIKGIGNFISLRKAIEKQGCRDWNNKIYRDQHKEQEKFKCVIHDILPYNKLICDLKKSKK